MLPQLTPLCFWLHNLKLTLLWLSIALVGSTLGRIWRPFSASRYISPRCSFFLQTMPFCFSGAHWADSCLQTGSRHGTVWFIVRQHLMLGAHNSKPLGERERDWALIQLGTCRDELPPWHIQLGPGSNYSRLAATCTVAAVRNCHHQTAAPLGRGFCADVLTRSIAQPRAHFASTGGSVI